MERVGLASAARELSALPVLVADRLGYLADEDLRVEFRGSDGGPAAAEAVAAGDVEFGLGGLWRVLAYRSAGVAALTVIGQAISRCFACLVTAEPIAELTREHLRGRRILVPWGSPSAPAILAGLSEEDDPVRLVSGCDAGEAATLFASGHVDSVLLNPLAAHELVAAGHGHVARSLAGLAGPIPYGVFYVRPALIDDPAARPARFLRAVQRARHWLTTHDDLAHDGTLRNVLADFLATADVEPAQLAVADLATAGAWAERIALPADTQERLQRMLVRHGILDAPLALSAYYDESAALSRRTPRPRARPR
ncbi:MAG TPA: ABC transporter substrate-binding protein [Pseudonocardiaceae bacterium]|nr:ABC transporter substrate-binding protein [Pseudonocardiaceae bacterium]